MCARGARRTQLYSALRISVQAGKFFSGERCLRIGFRRACIEDGVLIQWRALTLNGVNCREVRADEGRVFDEAWRARTSPSRSPWNQRDPHLPLPTPLPPG